MQTQEPLTEIFEFALTTREKDLLRELARCRGATMSGTLRVLIHKAAERKIPGPPHSPNAHAEPQK